MTQDPDPTVPDVVAAAIRLAPAVHAAREDAEQLRQTPPALAAEITRAGIYQMYLPRSVGGPEIPPLTAFRVIEELSSASVDGGGDRQEAASRSRQSDCLPHPAEMADVAGRPAMTLAPIRGAPSGAPIPDFPNEKARVKPTQPTAAPASRDQPPNSPIRPRYTPIEIGGGGIVLTFRVIPEQPAIARASMTVHIIVDAAGQSSSHTLGVLRMSAANARAFLTDLREGRAPIVATGDEDGTVQIEYEITDAGPVLLVRKPGQRHALHRWVIDRTIDLKATANDLLSDLGA